jgi:hypothetical protein
MGAYYTGTAYLVCHLLVESSERNGPHHHGGGLVQAGQESSTLMSNTPGFHPHHMRSEVEAMDAASAHEGAVNQGHDSQTHLKGDVAGADDQGSLRRSGQ